MARLAAAFGSSHSVMLAATAEDWTRFRESDPRMPYYDRDGSAITYADLLARAPAGAGDRSTPALLKDRFEAVQQAMTRMKDEIAAAKLDALVVVGDDQYELFQDQHMPALAVYYGDSIRNAAQPQPLPENWYKRAQARRREESGDVHYPCDAKLARHLIEGLVEREFDVSAVATLAEGQFEGHAYSFVHRWYLKGAVIPIVPVFLNTYNAPNTPLPKRCVRLGSSLREIILRYPENIRVGLIASGGLSHFVCDEELDRGVIDALRRKDFAHLGALDPRRLKAGSSEIRNWIVVAAAAADLNLEWISYTPVYRTPALTGIGLGFARWS
jgi:3-O-methylgallate 3,4-dioxygenase